MQNPACVALAGEDPETNEMDTFRYLFHRDLVIQCSHILDRLFAPSFIDSESSAKRLDGGLDAAPKPVRPSLRQREAIERCCPGDSSDGTNLAW